MRVRAGFCALALLAGGFVPARSPGLITHGSRRARLVALTFDADMTRPMFALVRTGRLGAYDTRIVQELERTRTPATFFLTGLWVRAYPRVARALARQRLFELGNHTLDHAAWQPGCYGLPTLFGQVAKRRELLAAARVIAAVTGSRPRYFRFPGGCQDEADVRLVRSLGELPVQWDVVSGDAWFRSPAPVERLVLSQVRPGSIVAMHLNGPPRTPATAPALATLIPRLRARGYRFVTLTALLGQPHAPAG